MDNRPLKEVTLPYSGYKVSLVERLKYGESLKIETALYAVDTTADENGNAQMKFTGEIKLKWDRAKLLNVVKRIFNAEKSVEIPVSVESIEDLDSTDVEFLLEEVEKVIDAQKKR